MQLYSTNTPSLRATLREAIFQGLPADNGLYMPVQIPVLPGDFIANLDRLPFSEIAFTVAHALIGDEIPQEDLRGIIDRAIDFPAPVVALDPSTYVLELFHGPSLAFKDFGARFMAQTMAYFNREEKEPLTILVATSGDTGGAVAAGFYQAPGIRVVILYPSGKVSPLQEKQLTTLGHNITALEVDGTFDDCQALVKQAFLDAELRQALRLSSANSINIARLIPQVFYYWESFKQVARDGKQNIVYIVPSGNFGNLTAGLMAYKMGLPVFHFVAATNVNDVVPEYLDTGIFKSRPSVRTLSNAMDVGNPSNFARMLDLYGSTWNIMQRDISGFACTDAQTRTAMRDIYAQHHYIMDPHGAVGYLAWKAYQQDHPQTTGIILETAHPSKFLEDVESILATEIPIPPALADLNEKTKDATPMPVEYAVFKNWLKTAFGYV